jgi:MFS family permease
MAIEPGEGAIEARPTRLLSPLTLFQISIFWFALNTIWGGFELFQQERIDQLTEAWAPLQIFGGEITNWRPIALGVMEVLAMFMAALTMPIAGSISDYTSSRWGRRKPFVLFGALLTFGALAGIAFFADLHRPRRLFRGPAVHVQCRPRSVRRARPRPCT